MTYVVTEDCIKCKYMDCVEVCPVDCFYVGENMLVMRNASTATFVCLSVRSMRSYPTPIDERRRGSS